MQVNKWNLFRNELTHRIVEEKQVDDLGVALGLETWEVKTIKNKHRYETDFRGMAGDVIYKWMNKQHTADELKLHGMLKAIVVPTLGFDRVYLELEQQVYGCLDPEKPAGARQGAQPAPTTTAAQTTTSHQTAPPTGVQESRGPPGGQSSNTTRATPTVDTGRHHVTQETSDFSPEIGDGDGIGESQLDRIGPKRQPPRIPGFDDDAWEIPSFPEETNGRRTPYSLTRNKRALGRAVIINNETFYGDEERRKGTDVDAVRIQTAMRDIGFEFTYQPTKQKSYFGNNNNSASDSGQAQSEIKSTVLKDPRKDDLLYALKEAAKMDFDDYACFCLFFLSHGGENQKLTIADSHSLSIRELTEPFKRCPQLVGKPKLFFIEACQGGSEDSGESADGPPGTLSKLPHEADCFVFYAASFGYKAWRHATKGSRFIQCLCAALQEYYKTKEIMEIAAIVNDMVSRIEVPCGTKQISMVTSTLRKPFYFTDQS